MSLNVMSGTVGDHTTNSANSMGRRQSGRLMLLAENWISRRCLARTLRRTRFRPRRLPALPRPAPLLLPPPRGPRPLQLRALRILLFLLRLLRLPRLLLPLRPLLALLALLPLPLLPLPPLLALLPLSPRPLPALPPPLPL